LLILLLETIGDAQSAWGRVTFSADCLFALGLHTKATLFVLVQFFDDRSLDKLLFRDTTLACYSIQPLHLIRHQAKRYLSFVYSHVKQGRVPHV